MHNHAGAIAALTVAFYHRPLEFGGWGHVTKDTPHFRKKFKGAWPDCPRKHACQI